MPTLDGDVYLHRHGQQHNHQYRQETSSSFDPISLSTQSAGAQPRTTEFMEPHPGDAVDISTLQIPSLPNYSYTPPTPANRLNISSSNNHKGSTLHPLPSTLASFGSRIRQSVEDNSPDPHDFYRSHQDIAFERAGSNAATTTEGVRPLNNQSSVGSESQSAQPHGQTRSRPSSPPVRTVSTRTPQMPSLAARANSLQAAGTRSERMSAATAKTNSVAPTHDTNLSNTKSSPILSSTARSRQSSLKDLVNKFNQSADQVPPLPQKSSSRSPSASSQTSRASDRARTISQARNASGRFSSGSFSSDTTASIKSVTRSAHQQQQPRRGRTHDSDFSNAKPRRYFQAPTDDPVPARPFETQTMLDLAPEIAALPRRPLFGELLTTTPSTGVAGSVVDSDYKPSTSAGYGIPTGYRRRSGSEGSSHNWASQSAAQGKLSRRDISPSSPSAWYLEHAPPLDAIKATREIPVPPPNLHRRTRSDYEGLAASPPTSQSYQPRLSPLTSPKQSTSTSPSRHGHSRIPLRIRPQSTASDSENSVPSSPQHLLKSPYTKSGPRTRAPPPQPLSSTRSSPRYSRSNTPQRSPHYLVGTDSMRPDSPHLAAYVSAPVPQKSPPLRSSRPRQHVSSVSTSTSRARVVEKLSGSDAISPRSNRDARPRRPPELGGVDFAARRQKIQRAFTRSVREEEEKEIWRASIARESALLVPSTLVAKSADPAVDIYDRRAFPEHVNSQHGSDIGDEPFAQNDFGTDNDPGDEPSLSSTRAAQYPAVNGLKIDTEPLPDRSFLEQTVEDSPTLGTFGGRYAHGHSQAGRSISTANSDREPGSAITAGTSDSVDTFFDDEPQADSPDLSRRHSAIHAIDTDDQSQGVSKEVIHDDIQQQRDRQEPVSDDEPDGRESIQIMLGATPTLERHPYGETHVTHTTKESSNSVDPADSRWSMSSWTSSNRSRDDRDVTMERIEEHSASPSGLHVVLSNDSAGDDWSPPPFQPSRLDRGTMDSDAYSTINRVLDQYHDPNLSPEMMHDAQQKYFKQSPDLAKQGGWDPKKVTQLYMQTLARNRSAQASSPDHDTVWAPPARRRTDSLTVPPRTSEKEVRNDMNEKMIDSVEHSRNVSNSSTINQDMDVDDGLRPARASLSQPGDFDMSPSLGGFYERAVGTPTDEKPQPPEKDEPFVRKRVADPLLSLPPINFNPDIDIRVNPPVIIDSPRSAQTTLQSGSLSGPHLTDNVEQARSKHALVQASQKPDLEVRAESHNESQAAHRPTLASQVSAASSLLRESTVTSETECTKQGSPSPDHKRLIRRRHIIKEIVDTEHSFGQDMKVVDDIYKGTSNVIIISSEDVKTLFCNSDQIVAFSTNFLDSLRSAARPVYVLPRNMRWKGNRVSNSTNYSTNTGDESSINGPDMSDEEKDRKSFIGEAFAHHMASMERVYAEYLKNHDAANQKLAQLQKNQKVQIWLKECKAYASDLTSAWDLDSLLVKPVQRILKYPLLLDQLLEATPEGHPDYSALQVAAREMKGISMRINESKKRAEIMEQVTTGANRKRKDSDMRNGLAKAFGRRAEKLKAQVGSTGMYDDKAYAVVSGQFAEHFVRLQVVMRDVEMYTGDVEVFVRKFYSFAEAIEAHIDVGQTSYPELESKWRKFRMSMREMSVMALPEHVEQVRKFVVQPMTTLVKLHEGPQKLMQKRDKRLPDYARYKAITDRGDRPDKKTADQGEQFQAVNDTLKDELPKLFHLTGKLMERCLGNFVQLQYKWLKLWKTKLRQAIDIPANASEGDFHDELTRIVKSFVGDFAFYEAQVASLGVCNGSLLNDTPNLVHFASPSTTASSTLVGDGVASPRTGPSFDSSRRTLSVSSDKSPMLPQPDFGNGRVSGSFFSADATATTLGVGGYREQGRRMRATSNVSGTSPYVPSVPGNYRSYSSNTNPSNPSIGRPVTSAGRTATEPSPNLRPSADRSVRPYDEPIYHRPSPSTYPSNIVRSPSPNNTNPHRYSGFFSSAMPMSDSPPAESPLQPSASTVKPEYNVIFLAASVYEFNIDRARKEAGYPYLTYVAGEIFDVIGEKGELWLAKNQDDGDCLIGWIWNKHFVKLAG